MAKVEVSTRIEAERRAAIEREAKRRGSSVAEILRERIEAGETIERMERIVEVLARTVGDLKGELKATVNRLDLERGQTNRHLARIEEGQVNHNQAIVIAIRELMRAKFSTDDTMRAILDAIKE